MLLTIVIFGGLRLVRGSLIPGTISPQVGAFNLRDLLEMGGRRIYKTEDERKEVVAGKVARRREHLCPQCKVVSDFVGWFKIRVF